MNRSPPLREQRLGFAQAAGQPLGRQLNQRVPGQVPQRVVDAFEAVQVQIEKRGHAALPPGARQRLAKPIFEDGPIGKAGQQVVSGLVRQLLFHPLALGDVGEQPVAVTLAVALMDVRGAAVEPDPLPVFSQEPVLRIDRLAVLEERPIGGRHPRSVRSG